MSFLSLKWLTSIEASEGVGQKMEQLVIRMSMSEGWVPGEGCGWLVGWLVG
jgi:hypothetical protein